MAIKKKTTKKKEQLPEEIELKILALKKKEKYYKERIKDIKKTIEELK